MARVKISRQPTGKFLTRAELEHAVRKLHGDGASKTQIARQLMVCRKQVGKILSPARTGAPAKRHGPQFAPATGKFPTRRELEEAVQRHHVDGLANRAIAVEVGVSRNLVGKILAQSPAPSSTPPPAAVSSSQRPSKPDDLTPEERAMVDAAIAAGRVRVIPMGVTSDQDISWQAASKQHFRSAARRGAQRSQDTLRIKRSIQTEADHASAS